MRYFDTHSHYTDDRFATEYPGGVDKLLPGIFVSGVERIINCAVNIENSKEVVAMASRYEGMYAAVGIHPEDCLALPCVDKTIRELCELLDNKEKHKIVAVGEIGLDYYHDTEHKELQKEYLEKQLTVANEYKLPVIIHDREAHGDVFDIVTKHSNTKGVFHSFSGSAEMAIELVKRGWYISFSGVISFKNARKTKEVAKVIPIDRILIETDCPYLAPEPFRGKLNRSDYLEYTLKALSEAIGSDEEMLSEQIFANSVELFGK